MLIKIFLMFDKYVYRDCAFDSTHYKQAVCTVESSWCCEKRNNYRVLYPELAVTTESTETCISTVQISYETGH